MGVKHFYLWYKNKFSSCVVESNNEVDVLAIDLNGLFHMCAQRIYRYGNVSAHLLYHSKIQLLPKTNLTLFRDVCEKIEYLRNAIRPRQKIVLCVDGVAGLGKMNQQRQRRFKTGATVKDVYFDPNAFTPGTKIMDHLTKYIDWYIRTMITLNPEWQTLDVIFSNEKVSGEGEHKVMQYLKGCVGIKEHVCIYGLDADLMMLGILLPHENVIIAREPEQGFIEYVNVRRFREELLKIMRWDRDYMSPDEPLFDKHCALNDFILLSFFVGNDFLPTIPTITILDGAIDIILTIYRQIGKVYGHLTHEMKTSVTGNTTGNTMGNTTATATAPLLGLNRESFSRFIQEFGAVEKEMLEKKYNSQHSFFPDPLVVKHMKLVDDKHVIDLEGYKKDYYAAKYPPRTAVNTVVEEYLHGMSWILNYYKNGIPDWTWFFPFSYGPFLTDFFPYMNNNQYRLPRFRLNDPIPQFLQLLMVLPQSSKNLVPEPLSQLMDSRSVLGHYFPDNFEIDITGKRKEWEGVVILPVMNLKAFKDEYDRLEPKLSYSDRKRNIFGKNFLYRYDPTRNNVFSSFYGNIPECPVAVQIITF
jgi:5'-3' exonuclease